MANNPPPLRVPSGLDAKLSAFLVQLTRFCYLIWNSVGAHTRISDYFSGLLDVNTEAAFKQAVNLEIGVDVQAYSANLDEAGSFFGDTDFTAEEAEMLTNGSNADALHDHEELRRYSWL